MLKRVTYLDNIISIACYTLHESISITIGKNSMGHVYKFKLAISNIPGAYM